MIATNWVGSKRICILALKTKPIKNKQTGASWMTQFCIVNAEVIPQCSWLDSITLSQWFHKPFPQSTTLTHHTNDTLTRRGEFKMDNTLKGLVRHAYYRCVCVLSRIRLFATVWTVVHQVPLSMEFSRQRYWSGLPFPTPGDLPNPGIKPVSPVAPVLQADSLPLSHQGSPWVSPRTLIFGQNNHKRIWQ